MKLSNIYLKSIFFLFQLLDGSIDRNNIQYQQAIERSQKLENHFTKLRDKVLASGGQRAIQRHTQVNKKILPRQRVLSLLDEGTELFDLCNLSGLGLDYGDIPGAGSVLGIGRVYGRYCLIHANESTIKSGAIYPVSVTKHLRAQQISRENRLPCIYIVDSAGAFLPLQSEVFPGQNHGGRVFFNEAVLSADNIPQVSIVAGSCTAGGAYVPTMSDEAIIVQKIGTIFLAGPPLVKAATGEIVSEDDLGGANLHCRVSGCTDYYAETEAEGYEMCSDIIASLGIPEPADLHGYDEPWYNVNDLDVLGGLKTITKENIYQEEASSGATIENYVKNVIFNLTDLEFKRHFRMNRSTAELLQGRDLTQRMKRYVTMNTRITVVQQNRGQYDLRQFLRALAHNLEINVA
ncbi:Uncharacterised protein g11437 [Pycnogonum litorale]